jgi:ferredoxin
MVDPDLCIGLAECVALDPEAVELDEHGTARIVISELDEQRAERVCHAYPVGALTVAEPARNVPQPSRNQTCRPCLRPDLGRSKVAIVGRLVEADGGDVELAAAPGRGLVAVVRLRQVAPE